MPHLPRATIRQIQRLENQKRYAIVFNKPLTEQELTQLTEVCKAAQIQVMILNNAQVIPLEQIAYAGAELAKPTREQLIQSFLSFGEFRGVSEQEAQALLDDEQIMGEIAARRAEAGQEAKP